MSNYLLIILLPIVGAFILFPLFKWFYYCWRQKRMILLAKIFDLNFFVNKLSFFDFLRIYLSSKIQQIILIKINGTINNRSVEIVDNFWLSNNFIGDTQTKIDGKIIKRDHKPFRIKIGDYGTFTYLNTLRKELEDLKNK